MTMPIVSLMIADGPAIDYTPGFHAVLEDHMTFLRTHQQTTQTTISPGDAVKYAFDFFGLLEKYNVPKNLQWVTMRVNGFTAPTQAPVDITTFLVPPAGVIGQIRQTYDTTHTLS